MLSLFRKLSTEILDFSSSAVLKIDRKLCESTDLNLFLALGRCKEWLNGSIEVGSSSVVVKISSSSSIKRFTGPIYLRDDLSDNSKVKSHVLCTYPFIRFSDFA